MFRCTHVYQGKTCWLFIPMYPIHVIRTYTHVVHMHTPHSPYVSCVFWTLSQYIEKTRHIYGFQTQSLYHDRKQQEHEVGRNQSSSGRMLREPMLSGTKCRLEFSLQTSPRYRIKKIIISSFWCISLVFFSWIFHTRTRPYSGSSSWGNRCHTLYSMWRLRTFLNSQYEFIQSCTFAYRTEGKLCPRGNIHITWQAFILCISITRLFGIYTI